MSKPILVANWKNYPDSYEKAEELIKRYSKKSEVYKKLVTFIAPPSTYYELVKRKAKNFAYLAVQDIFIQKGTYTGEVGVDILKSFGVRLSIIGHSERRALGETDEVVVEKIKTALSSGIIPLVCIGELERDHEGEYLNFVRHQIRSSLSGVRKKELAKKLVVAYEPVWAVGKGAKSAIEPEDLSQMYLFIKKILSDMYGREVANSIPILYGGSVDSKDAEGLSKTGVNGFLVGRASLDPDNFEKLAQALKN